MKLSLFDKIKLASQFNSGINGVQEGINMKDSTKVILAIVGLLTGVLQIQSIQVAIGAAIAAHPAIAAGLAGLSAILALLHVPVNQSGNKSGSAGSAVPVSQPGDKSGSAGSAVPMILLILALGMAAASPVRAQTTAIPPADGNNIYAVGMNYSVNASPGIAGSLLYARQALPDSGTWLFTNADFLPNTLRPFTVTNNVGAGVAQKIASFGKVPVYCITGAGVSWTGSNTGFQFNGGCMASIKVKNFLVMPSGRFLKSSVSNGTGYQPILGVYVGKRW